MKYFISAAPGPMPPTPEHFDEALAWLEGKVDDGTFDCIFGFLEGGGFSVANADSHGEVLDLMAEYPLFGLSTWDVRPLLDSNREATSFERNWPRPRLLWPEPRALLSALIESAARGRRRRSIAGRTSAWMQEISLGSTAAFQGSRPLQLAIARVTSPNTRPPPERGRA